MSLENSKNKNYATARLGEFKFPQLSTENRSRLGKLVSHGPSSAEHPLC